MALQSLSQAGKGGAGIPDQIPAALKELQGLTFNVLTGAAGNTKINVAAIRKEDTIVSAVMSAAGVLSDITGTSSIDDLRATGTLTVGTVVAGNGVTVNGKAYTFVAGAGNPLLRQMPILATPTLNAAQLSAMINMHDPIALVATPAAAVVTLFARAEGVGGNSIGTVVIVANVTPSGATLAGGSATGGVRFSGATTSNTVLLVWFNKQ